MQVHGEPDGDGLGSVGAGGEGPEARGGADAAVPLPDRELVLCRSLSQVGRFQSTLQNGFGQERSWSVRVTIDTRCWSRQF